MLSKLRDTNVLSDDIVTSLDESVEKFKLEFQTGDGKPLLSVGSEKFDELAKEDVNQEKIVKQKR